MFSEILLGCFKSAVFALPPHLRPEIPLVQFNYSYSLPIVVHCGSRVDTREWQRWHFFRDSSDMTNGPATTSLQIETNSPVGKKCATPFFPGFTYGCQYPAGCELEARSNVISHCTLVYVRLSTREAI